MNDDQKNFKDYISSLPAELQQAISAVDYEQKILEIAKNNKLMIDQSGKLETETTLIVVGLEPLSKYIGNLIDHVGLSNEQAATVAHDVDELIFKGIRTELQKINDEMASEDANLEKVIEETAAEVAAEEKTGTKENIISGIENPGAIKQTEPSVSLSSLKSNSANPETTETMEKGIEIKINTLPEIPDHAMLPMVTDLSVKKEEPIHTNVSPVENIVETKLTDTVVVPKQTVVVEEKTKLPEKPKTSSGDPYREAIM